MGKISSPLIWLLLAACLAACGKSLGGHAALGANASAAGPGIDAFEKGFWSFARKQGCVKCHEGVVHPMFAANDIQKAYQEAKGYRIGSTTERLIEFDDPQGAAFIVYAGNAHCGDTPCSDPAVRPEVTAALEAWALAETTQSSQAPPASNGGAQTVSLANYYTDSLALPAMIPAATSANPAVLRFPLKNLKPELVALKDAILEIEIQLINPTTYRVLKPKVAGNTAPVTFEGIHVFVKQASAAGIGIEDDDQGETWIDASGTAAVFAAPRTMPATPLRATPIVPGAVLIEKLSASDALAVGFEDVRL